MIESQSNILEKFLQGIMIEKAKKRPAKKVALQRTEQSGTAILFELNVSSGGAASFAGYIDYGCETEQMCFIKLKLTQTSVQVTCVQGFFWKEWQNPL